MHHGPLTDPADILLPRALPSRRQALGMLTRDEGEQLTRWDGKRVVPLDSESANYREWLVTVGPTEYCIIDDNDTWTVLYYAPDVAAWCATVADVEAFLATHKLILAA